jgi:phosphopantothenoylcysteine decarboxylase/phosphopantothenate--cysteine ligase
MAEPENIVQYLENCFGGKLSPAANQHQLKGKKVVITAGPTVEAIDPVRYISNHSTGKMGFALAAAFLQLGAEVILIKGPTPTDFSLHGIQTISVTTAFQMHDVAVSKAKDAETAAYGHMGRNNEVVTKVFNKGKDNEKKVKVELFTWEKLDYVPAIKKAFKIK